MKSIKIVILTSLFTLHIPLFGMFLDPVLKEHRASSHYFYETMCDNDMKHDELPDITCKSCIFCKKAFDGLKNYNELSSCDACTHTECLEEKLNEHLSKKNRWRLCPVCNIDYTNKLNKQHLQEMPRFVQQAMKIKLDDEQKIYDTELKRYLPAKFIVTTLLTCCMIYSHKKFHWTLDFCNSFIFGLLDNAYGLSSAQLHTSSDMKIKALGKFLYVLANKIIPSYMLYKSLNKKIMSDALLASVKINQPNKITLPSKKNKKLLHCHYHDQLLLGRLIEEDRSKIL